MGIISVPLIPGDCALIELTYLAWAAQQNQREGLKNAANYTGTNVLFMFFVIGVPESVVVPWLSEVGVHHRDVLMIWTSLKKSTEGVYESDIIHFPWSFENEKEHIF